MNTESTNAAAETHPAMDTVTPAPVSTADARPRRDIEEDVRRVVLGIVDTSNPRNTKRLVRAMIRIAAELEVTMGYNLDTFVGITTRKFVQAKQTADAAAAHAKYLADKALAGDTDEEGDEDCDDGDDNDGYEGDGDDEDYANALPSKLPLYATPPLVILKVWPATPTPQPKRGFLFL